MGLKGLPTSYTWWGKVFAPGSVISVEGVAHDQHGTSFAAPIVAATVALLVGTATQVSEEPSPHLIHNMITQTCDPVETERGEACLLNAYTAVSHYLRKLPPPPPAPPASMSIEEAIDDNHNGRIEDHEILIAVEYWIQGHEVPETGGKLIDTDKMVDLIQLWITGHSYE